MNRGQTGKIREPVPETGAGQRGPRPAPFDLALFKVGSNRLPRTAKPTEVGIWSKSDDAEAAGAPIAFEIQAVGKVAEISGGKAMAPDLVMAARGADLGLHPGIILALLKNILELDGDKIYHVIRCCLGH